MKIRRLIPVLLYSIIFAVTAQGSATSSLSRNGFWWYNVFSTFLDQQDNIDKAVSSSLQKSGDRGTALLKSLKPQSWSLLGAALFHLLRALFLEKALPVASSMAKNLTKTPPHFLQYSARDSYLEKAINEFLWELEAVFPFVSTPIIVGVQFCIELINYLIEILIPLMSPTNLLISGVKVAQYFLRFLPALVLPMVADLFSPMPDDLFFKEKVPYLLARNGFSWLIYAGLFTAACIPSLVLHKQISSTMKLGFSVAAGFGGSLASYALITFLRGSIEGFEATQFFKNHIANSSFYSFMLRPLKNLACLGNCCCGTLQNILPQQSTSPTQHNLPPTAVPTSTSNLNNVQKNGGIGPLIRTLIPTNPLFWAMLTITFGALKLKGFVDSSLGSVASIDPTAAPISSTVMSTPTPVGPLLATCVH